MRENEKERELPKASLPKVLLMIESLSLKSVSWDLYTTPATKITKMYELVTITWGTIWEEQNSESKSQQIETENLQLAKIRSPAKIHNPCEIARVQASFCTASLLPVSDLQL